MPHDIYNIFIILGYGTLIFNTGRGGVGDIFETYEVGQGGGGVNKVSFLSERLR